ncbi:MAG: hypothetical protein RR022_08605 [Angelakisella sp.]
MLKGVNKKVVEVMDIENEYFEKAILFIKAEQQGHDERTIKQRASDYLTTIRYVPRRAFSPGRLALALLKFSSAAMVGALAASVILH